MVGCFSLSAFSAKRSEEQHTFYGDWLFFCANRFFGEIATHLWFEVFIPGGVVILILSSYMGTIPF